MQTTWTDADAFKLLRHPIPGSFGLHGMRAACTIAENGAPQPKTAYIGYNLNRTMLVILYVRHDGRSDVIKAYSGRRTRTFDVDAVLTARTRLCDNTRQAMEQLLNQLLEAQAEEG